MGDCGDSQGGPLGNLALAGGVALTLHEFPDEPDATRTAAD